MLTSLIAIKMYEKEFGARIIGATIFTSGISILLATLIGFGLTFIEQKPHYFITNLGAKKSYVKADEPNRVMPLKHNDKISLFPDLFSTVKIETKTKVRKLSLNELKFIDEKILAPILRLSEAQNENSAFLEKELNKVAQSADAVGVSIKLYGSRAFHPDYVELKGNYPEQFIGTFYFRLLGNSEIILESDSLSRQSLEISGILEEKFKPKVILFSAIFFKDSNGVLECEAPVKYVKGSFFDLANQISIRELDKKKKHTNVVQIKTVLGRKSLEPNTVYVSTNTGSYSLETLNDTQKEICAWILSKGYKVKFVSGADNTAGLESINLLSGRYLDLTNNTSLIVLWLGN